MNETPTGICEPLRAATHQRPADRVTQKRQYQAERCRRALFQRQHRVRGQTGEKRAGFFGGKITLRQGARRSHASEAEAGRVQKSA